jgi:N-succinyldiaminopimelate aminotransferase
VAAALGRLAERHGLWVLADEVYEDLAYVATPPPIWTLPAFRERTLATHSFSKAYAMAGARVGYTHGPPEIMRAVRGVQTFKTYCAPTPFQHAAVRALEEDAWLEETRALYASAGRCAAEALGVAPPESGTFLFFDVAPFFRPGEGLEEFLERCLDAGVLLTPGPAAGAAYGTFVRLCFTAVPPEQLDQALARLRPVMGR